MNITETIQSAFHAYQAGNLRQAEHFCMEVLKEQPNNEAILYLLGIVYAGLGEYDSAVKNLERLLELNPENADAYLALGGICHQQGLSDKSVRFYQQAIGIDPDLGEAHENLGDIFRDSHQPDEAMRHYKKALQLSPDAAEIYLKLGDIFKEKGQDELAVFHYRSALRHKPDYAGAFRNLGMLYHERTGLDEAIAYYQKALRIDPYLPDTRVHLENALREQNQYHEALFDYGRSLAVKIKFQYFQIEMLINALINQFYFRTMQVQFHPDVPDAKSLASGSKRSILEKIAGDMKEIDDFANLFSELERLDAIRQYFEDPDPKIISRLGNNSTQAGHHAENKTAVYDRVYREFLSIAARVEARLVKILNS
ncbi:MAG: tetratricopeptide repeat protein [Nitrospirota bacterium]